VYSASIAHVRQMNSEALDGQLQSCYTARATCLMEDLSYNKSYDVLR